MTSEGHILRLAGSHIGIHRRSGINGRPTISKTVQDIETLLPESMNRKLLFVDCGAED